MVLGIRRSFDQLSNERKKTPVVIMGVNESQERASSYRGGQDKDGIVPNANFGGRVEDGTK